MDCIVEKHCCKDCRSKFSVPVNPNLTKWELCCKKRRSELNRDGGLTDCPCFEGD